MFDVLPTDRADRWSLLTRLMQDWHQPPLPEHGCPAAELDAAEARLGLRLPAALREWYALCGRHANVWSRQDRLRGPADLGVEDGVLRFYDEAQNVVRWGIPVESIASDDPPVVVEDLDCAGRYLRVNDALSEFVLTLLVYTRKSSNRNRCYGAAPLARGLIDHVVQNYSPLPVADWPWPAAPTKFFQAADVLLVLEGLEEWSWLYVLAREEAGFRQIERQLFPLGLTWDACSDEWPPGWVTLAGDD